MKELLGIILELEASDDLTEEQRARWHRGVEIHNQLMDEDEADKIELRELMLRLLLLKPKVFRK
jgi:hypothetical protein